MAEPEQRPYSADQRPYAAPSNVIAVISRARTRNLPEAITNDFFRIAGVPEVVFGRVANALRFLNLIHEDGRPTDEFKGLAAAGETEYRELLSGIVRNAYRAELSNVDPGQDTQAKIMDAFRRYQPRSQTQRMVILLLGLCREAGIPVLDAPRQRGMSDTGRRPAGGSARAPSPRRREPPAPGPMQTAPPPSPPTSGLLFGVTEADIGALNDDEFTEVWTALGKVARARARARTATVEGAVELTAPTDGDETGVA